MHRSRVLADLIERHGLKVGAEIGVGSGPTTDAVLSSCPDIRWIAVDHFPAGYPTGDGTPITQERQDHVRRRFYEKMKRFEPRLQHLDMPSIEAAATIDNGSLDLVFIDDDHSYEGCKASIHAWRPKLRPGGWLTGHDFDAKRFPGVVRAVNELVPDFALADDFVWLTRV